VVGWIILAFVAGFVLGGWCGFRLACWAIRVGFEEGRFDRPFVDRLVGRYSAAREKR
jgi:hypothetical protein